MNTLQIDNALRRNKVTRQSYMGCYASNKLPKCKKFPCSLVANTDEASEPGTHWIAIYAPNRLHVRYFDSLDGDEVPNIHAYLTANFVNVTRQKFRVQSPRSTVCGYYAIYFIYMSCLNYPYRAIERILLDHPNPDKYVVQFVNRKILKQL